MYIAKWILISGGLLLVWLVLAVRTMWRQIRCLRYCYIDMSDWAEEQLSMAATDSDYARFAVGEWGQKVDHHARLMRRVRLSPVDRDDKRYPSAMR